MRINTVSSANRWRLSVTSGTTAVPVFLSGPSGGWDLVRKPGKDAPHPDPALASFFTNGGDFCYQAGLSSLDDGLDSHEDVTMVVQAGAAISVSEMGALCHKHRVFGLYDWDGSASVSSPSGNQGAVYGPSLKGSNGQSIAPSAAVAGVYCRVDRERGVWKAPANVPILGGCTVPDVDDTAKLARDSGVNVIRSFDGGTPTVWGARTTAPHDDFWCYVPVRRLFNAVEKDIKKAMSAAVFEPNNDVTWAVVRGAIDNYLHQLWVNGALLGKTPDAAYSVLVGMGASMTNDDLVEGRMNVRVGLAAVRPAEQILLQFSQLMER